jgi:abortive infection bacteriophage resistance protein
MHGRPSYFMPYNKPYLTIPQQRALLESRGMEIPDPAKAAEYLQRIGYYRLSAYWHPFRQVSANINGKFHLTDSFKPGTQFKHVTDLYAFDKALRLLVLDAIERIEISVRTEFALAIGRIDPWSHRFAKNFNKRFQDMSSGHTQSRYDGWLSKLDDKATNSKEEFAQHFRNAYAGTKMPIWIAVELLDFGPLSVAVKQLHNREQQMISASYGGTSFRLIQSWIRALCNIRNICAHHSRLWNKPFTNQPALPKPGEAPDLDHLSKAPDTNKRIYAALCVMRFLLRYVNPRTKWADRLKTHIQTFPDTAPNITLKNAGFPEGWETLPLWNSA